MITPNQFEAELLADVVIRTEANAISAAAKLIGMGPEIVIITSTELDDAPGKQDFRQYESSCYGM